MFQKFQIRDLFVMCGKENIMANPLVIAHRGASGYRPENTLEAFELGLSQGADGLEFDLVVTKDKALVIRHENALSGTTNISKLEEFRKFKRAGVVEGEEIEDWFTEDLDLNQMKNLRAVERLPDLRPGSSKFDGEFSIPTFSELLEQQFISGKILVCEIKAGSHLDSLATPVGELVAKAIAASNASSRSVYLIIESFDYEVLMGAKQAMDQLGVSAKYFLALDDVSLAASDLDSLSEQVDGLAISLAMLRSEPDWVEKSHGVGIDVWVYTARAEEAETSIEAYYSEIIQTGVDGIFADQPDLLRRVIADSSGSAYDY
jgi:glycerophosphoryl diester phosphodiesterase